MYLSKKKLAKSNLSGKIQLITGTIGLVFFGVGVIGGMFSEDLRDYWYIYLVLMFPFVWLLWLGFCKMRLLKLANHYNSMFVVDDDGYLPLQNLSNVIGKTMPQITKELTTLLHNGYLEHCSLELGVNPRIILSSTDGQNQMVPMKCPNCGATALMRAGFTGYCEYCDTKFK